MKYLFEDKADDPLSKLFRYSLPETVQRLLVYADGNGNLVRKAEELLQEGETVIVVLDTVPANKSIRDIYISLRRLSRVYDYRLVVWNVLCAEYYFIRSFGRNKMLKAFVKDTDFEIVAGVLPYKESRLIETEEDRAFTKTFEKFCKLYVMKNGGACVYPEDFFFVEDCHAMDCLPLSLREKSDAYRGAYEISLRDVDSWDNTWHIHRKLLKIINEAIERYNEAGYLKIKQYPEIK